MTSTATFYNPEALYLPATLPQQMTAQRAHFTRESSAPTAAPLAPARRHPSDQPRPRNDPPPTPTAPTKTSKVSSPPRGADRVEAALFDVFSSFCRNRGATLHFNDLLRMFEALDIYRDLSQPGVMDVLRAIQPPPGRQIAWRDFLVILEVVAGHKFPEVPANVAVADLIDHILRTSERADATSPSRSPNVAKHDVSDEEFPPLTHEQRSISGATASSAAAPLAALKEAAARKEKQVAVRYLPRGVSRVREAIVAFAGDSAATSATAAQQLCDTLQWGNSDRCVAHAEAMMQRIADARRQLDEDDAAAVCDVAVWEFASSCACDVFPRSTQVAAEELTFTLLAMRLGVHGGK